MVVSAVHRSVRSTPAACALSHVLLTSTSVRQLSEPQWRDHQPTRRATEQTNKRTNESLVRFLDDSHEGASTQCSQ